MTAELLTRPLQTPDEVRDNPVALDQSVAKSLVDVLNTDLSSLYVLYHQTKKHHWIVEGAERQEIHLLLDAHSKAQLEFADQIAERIVDLGGVPVSAPAAQSARAYVTAEVEGAFPIRTMLENDLAINRQIIVKLREHIRLANQLGDFATEYLLKEGLYNQEGRTNDIADHLAEDSLMIKS